MIDFDTERRCTCKIPHHVFSLTIFNALITSMDLGPCLLKYNYPELRSYSSSELGSMTTLDTGNIVVNDNFLPETIFTHPNCVHSILVFLTCHKESFNSIRMLGKDCERTQEISITESSLLNVFRINRIIKQTEFLIRLFIATDRCNVIRSSPFCVS